MVSARSRRRLSVSRVRSSPPCRRVIAALETRRALDGLAALGQSHRARLAEALRDHADDVSATGQAQRLGTFKAVEPFLKGPDGRAPRCGIELKHALRITNWWRPGTVLAGSGW